VGPRAGLDAVAKREISNLCRQSKPGRPACSLLAVISETSWSCIFHVMDVLLVYEGVPKSLRTGRLERELQMVQQFSATRCSCIAVLCVSLVSFAAITLCVASQRVFIVVFTSLCLSPGTFGPTLVLCRGCVLLNFFSRFSLICVLECGIDYGRILSCLLLLSMRSPTVSRSSANDSALLYNPKYK
jgi:hypothetical protein